MGSSRILMERRMKKSLPEMGDSYKKVMFSIGRGVKSQALEHCCLAQK